MLIQNPDFWVKIMLPALKATLEMTVYSTIISTVLGTLVAVLLLITNERGMFPNKIAYGVLSVIINVVRSFPFIILIIFIIPLTRAIVGTTIGVKGAIVPLVVAATAFIAKIVENAMQEVDQELVEGMRSFGLTKTQVIFRVIFSEALPAVISGIVLATISILGCTAMAGTVGAGGIGAVALLYGYQSFRKDVMLVTVAVLVILAQIIQSLGNFIYKKMAKKK